MARPKSATVDIKIRMKEPLRKRIEKASKGNRVSMNAEMNARLERSFAEEKSQDEAVRGVYASFGKLENFLVARTLANAIQTIEAKTGKNWMDDWEAHRQTQEACKTILDAFRPPAGERPIPTDLISEGRVAAGTDAATKALMAAVGTAEPAAKFFRTKKKG